jgi:hypothetical protein
MKKGCPKHQMYETSMLEYEIEWERKQGDSKLTLGE